MIEAVMFWNEPNNKSHWDFEVDPDWSKFAAMVKLASEASIPSTAVAAIEAGVRPMRRPPPELEKSSPAGRFRRQASRNVS